MFRPGLRSTISRRPLARGATPAPVAAPTSAYKVKVAFAVDHVMNAVDDVVQMTDAQAKYHLLAKRIVPVSAANVLPPVIELPAPSADGEQN